MKHYSTQSQYAQIRQSTHYIVGDVVCAWWCVFIAILTALLVCSLASNAFYAYLYFQRINEVCNKQATVQMDAALQLFDESNNILSLFPLHAQFKDLYSCCDKCND